MGFKTLDKKIRQVLDQGLDQGLISREDLLVICLELGNATNEEELREKLTKLANRYPVFKEI